MPPDADASTTGSVHCPCSFMRRLASRYSPQAVTKLIITTTTMPLRTIGSRIVSSSRIGPAPSIRAASKRSRETVWNTPRMTNTEMATLRAVYGKISPQAWLISPRAFCIWKMPMNAVTRVGKKSEAKTAS